MKKLIVITALAAVTATTSGCIALPAVAMINDVHKSGVSTYEIAGPEKSLPGAFRAAVQHAGGMVEVAAGDYGRGKFASDSVLIEYQKIGGGRYQLAATSANSVSRAFDFKDSLSVRASEVAKNLESAGYVISAQNRERGI